MNLDQFKTHIKSQDDEILHQYGKYFEQELTTCKDAQTALGYRMAINELLIELKMREPFDQPTMTDDELIAALNQ